MICGHRLRHSLFAFQAYLMLRSEESDKLVTPRLLKGIATSNVVYHFLKGQMPMHY